jgi:hypothetical protein
MLAGDYFSGANVPSLDAAAFVQRPCVAVNNDCQRLGGQRSLGAAARRKSTPFHGADGAGALQAIGQQWPSVHGNDDRQRLGGQRSLAAAVRRKSTRFHGADGAGALQAVGKDSRKVRRRFREAGVSLVELSISLFLVMTIAIFGLQTMMSAWLTQNWSIMQSMTDAYAGIETAYAQRWTFAEIPTSNRWPVYPLKSSNPVTIGQTPKGPVNATVARTSRQFTDPLTGAQSYMLESYVLYQDHQRQYCKVSKVYRTE